MNENQREFLENCKKNNVIGKIQINHNLSKYTWFGVAGNAEIFYMPPNFEELAKVLEINRDKLPVTVIGAGSNIIIRDGGIFGLVIKLGKEFSQIKLHNDCIEVGAATYDRVLSNYCQKNEIGGMEFYFGIPGTLGGAVRMNAGCYNSETKDVFIKAKPEVRIGFKADHVLELLCKRPGPLSYVATDVNTRPPGVNMTQGIVSLQPLAVACVF
ncbi:MAG: hypothetical protein CL507_01610 [Actinobacteria bacterium]|nr:hypothetical protein [Actinomycetota bacterium]